MNHEEHPTEPRAPDGDALAQLISSAGRRDTPPAHAYEQTLRVATDAWRAKLRARRWRLASAMAASVVLAVGVAIVWRVTHMRITAPTTVARLDRSIGTVEQRTPHGEWSIMGSNTIVAGTSLRTGADARAGFLLQGGQSLRLAAATEVTLLSASQVQLAKGKTYVDTGGPAARRVEVLTEAGTAFDVGTQFEIQYQGDRFRLRVREGAVILRRDAAEIRSAAGEQLSIESDGAIHRALVEANDADWQWVEALAPTPIIDGRSVAVLLAWVARETGRKIQYADRDTQRRTEQTILHGSIDHLEPLEALRVMLATTDLQYRLLEDGSIRVALKGPP